MARRKTGVCHVEDVISVAPLQPNRTKQLVEQSLRIVQVGSVESLYKHDVNGDQWLAGFRDLALEF